MDGSVNANYRQYRGKVTQKYQKKPRGAVVTHSRPASEVQTPDPVWQSW